MAVSVAGGVMHELGVLKTVKHTELYSPCGYYTPNSSFKYSSHFLKNRFRIIESTKHPIGNCYSHYDFSIRVEQCLSSKP
jgi:hypothetical protein